MRSNFNLIAEQHNPVLQFLEPGEAQENVSSTLATVAQKLVLNLTPNQETVFVWTAIYPAKQHLSCIYFERINLNGCKMIVRGKNGAGSEVEIISCNQRDDYLLALMTTAVNYDTYVIELTVPDQGATPDQLSITPPFLGGVDMCDLGGYCYSWGRQYQYSDPVSYQRTENLSYPQSQSDMAVKNFSIDDIHLHDTPAAFKFIRQNKGKLMLFIEHDHSGQEDLILGYVSGNRSTRTEGNFSSLPLVATAKNARI